jgi:sialate O-acetylesterase
VIVVGGFVFITLNKYSMLAILHPQKFIRRILFLVLLFPLSQSFAQFTVAPIFGSNMVLQRGTTVPVFGTAAPGATVGLQFNGQSKSSVANSNGKWRIDLTSMAASTAPLTLTATSGSNTITLTGVQVGEVWLCSGQSNMGFPLSNADSSAPAIASAGNHNIRLFRMTAGNGPATTTWQVSNSSTAGSFSAVGYWMGLELSKWLGNIPVGLIQATHDGTAIEHWQHTSGGIGDDYDAMVKAIQPFAVKGIQWYQGESNGGDADYRNKLTNMIREWRSDWGQAVLPFGIIQLAYRSGWNVARNAQLEVADTEPNCFLVVIRDLPGGSLHPSIKKPVGIRAAIGARGNVYGEGITYSGPVRDIANSYVSGNKIILNWKFTGNGLITNDGKAPGGFSVATATGQFKTATAVIVGNTVEITSPVTSPARVQYAYSSIGNLYNQVNIGTEGNAVTVTRLKASEFEIKVAPKPTALTNARFSVTAETQANKKVALIFPNPAPKGAFSIAMQDARQGLSVNIQVVDASGKIVYLCNERSQSIVHVNADLKPGVYVVQVKDANRVLVQQELVVVQ